jgi:hypothetical protein
MRRRQGAVRGEAEVDREGEGTPASQRQFEEMNVIITAMQAAE